jgi:hypothetical protein
MLWEAIPSSILQIYAIIKRFEDREWVQIVSLFVSVLSVGIISSKMSYFVDTSVKSRGKSHFYGYVPSSKQGRAIIQLAMIGLASSQLLARSLSYALTAVSVGKAYAFLAVMCEMGLYFLYKLARKDFYYLSMNLSGFARFMLSFLARFQGKIIADFASLLLARHPHEMGGFYFSVNAMMSQVVLWGSIMLYIDKMMGEESEDANMNVDRLTKEILYSIGRAISSVWVVSVAAFFSSCNKEFIWTFFSTTTSRTYTKQSWDWQLAQKEPKLADEVIVQLFSKHHDAYEHFELEVSAFVSENWEKWNYEKPKFFTKKFVASIPFSVLSKEIREEIDG